VRGRVRYQAHPRGWTALLVKYGSGLPVALDGAPELDDLTTHYGSAIVGRVDFEAERLRPTFALDWSGGFELWRRDKRRVEMRAEVANLTDRVNVVNFAGLFSGTAIAPPRSASVRLRMDF
jgi:hypothetical protein